ncbi:MAG: 23S rRNA (pseudouridine(1915)-N(3))-methyltransferase RlmH [Methylococcales bacterium]
MSNNQWAIGTCSDLRHKNIEYSPDPDYLTKMKIDLLAIGDKMPVWVETGFNEYAHRLPTDSVLQLRQVRAVSRGKKPSITKIIAEEEKRLRSAMPNSAHIVALDVMGKQWSTPQLAKQLNFWRELGKPIALVIGGADGLSPNLLSQAAQSWSLSPLTIPHYLVRVIVAEQIYRAWSILNGHPYHRA